MANLDLVNKDLDKINPELVKFLNVLIQELKLKNYDFRIFEGYRSNERQNYLYSVKKTTSLKGGQSKHNKIPSEAVSIVQYIKNQPTWGGFILTEEFKKIVNGLLLRYPRIEWGGNWKNKVPYQFEIKSNLSNILPIPITPVIVNPPQVNPIKPLPVAIVPPPKVVTPVVSPVAPPSVQPAIIQPPSVPVKIPTQAPLVPASVKMEVDNSSIIVIGVLAVAFLFLRK
jgi:hypothetical protein